ncbi:MAG: hypothetical protein QOJ01_416, partial [Solirubrobacterales bacterium]|nr:hypothetical protein [Solirubrobacterales bacterium]
QQGPDELVRPRPQLHATAERSSRTAGRRLR